MQATRDFRSPGLIWLAIGAAAIWSCGPVEPGSTSNAHGGTAGASSPSGAGGALGSSAGTSSTGGATSNAGSSAAGTVAVGGASFSAGGSIASAGGAASGGAGNAGGSGSVASAGSSANAGAAGSAGNGSGGSGAAGGPPTGCNLPATVSFKNDVQKFLSSSCSGTGCHVIDDKSTMASGGYDHAYDWITATSHASSCPSGAPKRFEVVLAVINGANPASCSKSRVMPPDPNMHAPLTPCQVATLQAWLAEPLVTQLHRADDTSPTTPYAMPPFN